MIILDDLQALVMDSKSVLEVVTVRSHHANISTVILLQNIFSGGRYARTIALQAQYMVAMRSPRDRGQLAIISRQIFGPHKQNFIPEVMERVLSESAYGYIVIDLTAQADAAMRIRTCVFPKELMQVYLPM